MITFMISAFWHGFYPFYYITFSFVILASFAHKDVYGMRILFRSIPSQIRTASCIFLTQTNLSYGLALMNARTFENGFRFMSSTYYIGFIALGSVLLMSRGPCGLLRLAKKWTAK